MGEGDDESSVEVDFGWWLREAATFELCNSARPQAWYFYRARSLPLLSPGLVCTVFSIQTSLARYSRHVLDIRTRVLTVPTARMTVGQ